MIYLSNLASELLAEQMASHDHEQIFPPLRGDGERMVRPVRAFRKICADNGIAGFTLHSLRHAAASIIGHMYSNVVAQHALRHQSAKTSELYIHPLADSLRSAAEMIAGLVDHSYSAKSVGNTQQH